MTIDTHKLRKLMAEFNGYPWADSTRISIIRSVPGLLDHIEAQAAEIARLREALSDLLSQWDKYRAGEYPNQEDAYYKLDKYARPHWDAARAALSGEGK